MPLVARQNGVRILTSATFIYLKAGLLLTTGCLAGLLLLARSPSVLSAALLAITVWAFCRAYYFAFYVVERYVDPSYKFSGLLSFARYVWSKFRVI